ncbi:MAG: non-heme iron oxygenase ferredoxin subunit [Chloroflexi bacterium]|nr:non-heme iron oxygenase ferredoxin subunit [Chloroflexota bacterium]
MANFVAAAKLSEIQPGQMKALMVGTKSVLVANWEGTLFATQDLCTHDGGTLADGELIDGEIECPRHGGRFDPKTGAVTALPPMFPIKTYPIKIEGDAVLIAID